MRKVTLLLDDGTKFHGTSFGYEKPVAGEFVFNTDNLATVSPQN
jgi:carbamoyl-phosphate synthase small subunit